MKSFVPTSTVLMIALIGLTVAFPAQEQNQQPELVPQASEPVEVVRLVPVADGASAVPDPEQDAEGQRTKRHIGFGGVGIGVGVGLVGGGFGGYPGFGYGGGYPGYGYGGFYPGYGYGGYRRFGYRYGGYGYGGGFGYPYF